jgi:prepilin-type N-terminal cleavage/methylation domain-containing protein
MRGVRRRLRAVARSEDGFTIFELLIVLAILGTIVGAIVTLFTSALQSEVDLTSRVRAQEQARLGLDMLRRDVHCARETSGLAEGVASSTVTFVLPAGCPSVTTERVTWCTKATASPSRHTLYRVAGADCNAAGGVTWADHLTEPNAFTYEHTSGKRARLGVTLLVDIDPASPTRAYALSDALVLRNSPR